MKLRLRKRNLKPVKSKAEECFNCGHPFFGHEKFCPECGQANKNPKITFGNFVHEVFNGFISWDSKFWTTFIPLLIKPGKVSKDYIEGKRQRYANPFRFYLTISVLFFVILGMTENYDKFNEFRTGKGKSTSSINEKIDSTQQQLAASSKNLSKNLDKALQDIDSVEREEIKKVLPEIEKSIPRKTAISNRKRKRTVNFGGLPMWNDFYDFQEKYPDVETEDALDSLKVAHTFYHRFLYSRVKAVADLGDDNTKIEALKKQFISYLSISLFIFLPIFTLSLKFYYIRRSYTYVEHLVFVFHTQTVFFLLLTIFFLINYFRENDNISEIFFIIFLLYLYLAMKRFYQQGYFKTFFKFLMVNFSFFIVSIVGVTLIAILTFVMY